MATEPIEIVDALKADELPAVFRQADAAAVRWRKRYVELFRAQILLLLTAALASAASPYAKGEGPTFVALVCFLIVAGLRLHQHFSSTGARWHKARLAAERIKSLAWSYTVGAAPFGPEDSSPGKAERGYRDALRGILADWPARGAEEPGPPTAAMQRLRASPLGLRQRAYAVGRIMDQVAWYGAKAHANIASARLWDLAFLVISVAAIIGGALQIAQFLEFDLLRLAGFIAALIVSWTGLNQHRRQARIYERAANDLRSLAEEVAAVHKAESWSRLVQRCEAYLCREVAGWLAAHD